MATHFKFDAAEPMASHILLGDETRLTLEELKDYRYDFAGVDLVTLSACQTAMGSGHIGPGREIEGLGGFIQKRGAKAVIATLWPVHDNATARLMAAFYRNCTSGMSKVMALREAQLGLLSGDINSHSGAGRSSSAETDTSTTSGSGDSASPPPVSFHHPYFWAPFILMGNPR